MKPFSKGIAGLTPLFNAIPKGAKWNSVSEHAQNVEVALRHAGQTLGMLRNYFLETTGEDSPFVKKIDEFMDRPEKK